MVLFGRFDTHSKAQFIHCILNCAAIVNASMNDLITMTFMIMIFIGTNRRTPWYSMLIEHKSETKNFSPNNILVQVFECTLPKMMNACVFFFFFCLLVFLIEFFGGRACTWYFIDYIHDIHTHITILSIKLLIAIVLLSLCHRFL